MPVPADITIQVLSSSGAITNVSADADRLVPIVSVAQARALAHGGGAMQVRGAPFDMPSLLRVVVVPADGGQLVIAAVPFSEASGSLNVVARTLVIFTPVLFLVFTGAIWLVTGSTLRPIGALRRGAARVTATAVPSDLPVPEARDEVRLLALTLNDMLSRLAEAQQRQRALVSDTAHELRSPIASIRTQLEVALDFPATPGLGDDGAGRPRGRAAARPARRGPAAARPPRRTGGPGRPRRPGGEAAAACPSTWPSSAARSSAATRMPASP